MLLLILRGRVIISQLVNQVPNAAILQLDLLHLGTLVVLGCTATAMDPVGLVQLTLRLPVVAFQRARCTRRGGTRGILLGYGACGRELLLLQAFSERVRG